MINPFAPAVEISVPRALKDARVRWLAGPLLLATLVAYCELSSLLGDSHPPGLAVSVRWALQVASGWIFALAALHRIAPRIRGARLAKEHPFVVFIACVVGTVMFTLSCEWSLSNSTSVFSFVYIRLPMHALLAALLLLTFAWLHAPTLRTSSHPSTQADESPTAPPSESVLEVMTGTGHTTIRLDQIEWFKAERNYISVMHSSGRSYLLRRTMTALQQELDPANFARVHRSIIVNRNAIKERRAGGVLLLHSGATVRVSRAHRDALECSHSVEEKT